MINDALKKQVLECKKVTCLHILGQDLVNQLVDIILEMNNEIEDLESKLDPSQQDPEKNEDI